MGEENTAVVLMFRRKFLPGSIWQIFVMWPPATIGRLILPALFAIGAIGVIELAIDLRYRPDFWKKTPWLMHDPYRGELFDRVEMYVRLSHLENSDPEIISVGDSSGFFSLQSTIVNRYTHGRKFLSLNTGANQAYIGYRAIAEYMLRRSTNIKYVVLYLFPQILPQEAVIEKADLGPITEDSLVSLKSYRDAAKRISVSLREILDV